MSFTGLMIDGPHAGEWFTDEAPRMAFVEWGGVRKRPGSIARFDYNEPVETTYVHVSDSTAGAFWVPEGKDVAWAVKELVETYREVQGRHDPVAPADDEWE